MTKQEFDNIVCKANLNVADDELYDMVIGALSAIEVLDKYDGEAYEEN